jgi:replication factor C subunit 1
VSTASSFHFGIETDRSAPFSFAEAAERRKKEGVDELDKPPGLPSCLAGLTFVFTGELHSMSREESTEVAKRLGASVI